MQYNKWIRDWKTALAENFFLRSLCLLLGLGLIMNASVFKSKERIIISPPQVSKQFWVEKNRASQEYLEQMAVFFATLGGNLSPESAEFNVSSLYPYINAPSMSDIKADLAAQAQYIKKNNITQVFFATSVSVDTDLKTALVVGNVVRNIGTTKISQEEMIINMKFSMDNYRLWLQEFYMEYPSRIVKKEKEKQDKLDEKKKGKNP